MRLNMTEKMGNAYNSIVLFIAGFGVVLYGSTHDEYNLWGMGFAIICIAVISMIVRRMKEEVADRSRTWVIAYFALNVYFASMIVLTTAYFVIGALFDDSREIAVIGVTMMSVGYVPYFFASVGLILASKFKRMHEKNNEWICGGKME